MHGRFVRGKPIVEMNLIPLIDVSLILVIIFMILTPVLLQSQLSVRLPSAREGSSVDVSATVRVQLSPEGRITVDGKSVPAARLERELTLKLSRSASKTLLVQAARTVPIEKVVAVLDIAKRLKVGKLGIAVSPPEP